LATPLQNQKVLRLFD